MTTSVERKTAPAKLDAANPWPGLEGFHESHELLFKGRREETAEFVRMVRSELLSVLYGKSGMGKSSLLRAGVFPELRRAGFVPIYIRLKHDERELPLGDQVEVRIEKTLRKFEITAPDPIREQTLWEYFHRRDVEWWDKDIELLTPVLVFDQFEEVLTVGRESPGRRVRSDAFLTELEDLVEHRIPDAIRAQLDANPELAQNYRLSEGDFRVVICLREDYLPELEGLRARLKGIMSNRFRLLPMTGLQARDVVLQPARGLVEEDAALQIVDRISRSRRAAADEAEVTLETVAERQVEPALLSILCSQLNLKRLEKGLPTISKKLVAEVRVEAVLQDFYDKGMRSFPEAVHDFVEERLITESGARNRYSRDDALQRDHISEEVLQQLIDSRILRQEVSGSTAWLELTHDRLADVARLSRDKHRESDAQAEKLRAAEERERETQVRLLRAKRRVRRTIYFSVLILALVMAVGFNWLRSAKQKAAAELAEKERQRKDLETQVELQQLQKQSSQIRDERDSIASKATDTLRILDGLTQELISRTTASDARDRAEPEVGEAAPPVVASEGKLPISELSGALVTSLRENSAREEVMPRERLLLEVASGLFHHQAGQLKTAEQELSMALPHLERVSAEEPAESGLSLRLCQVRLALGDIAQETKRGDSRALYQAALDLAQKQQAAAASKAAWTSLVAQVHDRLGDAALHKRSLNEARKAYAAAQASREQLLKDQQADEAAATRLLLARGQNKIGNTYFAEVPSKAREQYREALQMLAGLKNSNPTVRTEVQQLTGIVQSNIGKASVQMKDRAAALKAFQEQVRIFTPLYEQDPGNAQYRSFLAAGLNALAYYTLYTPDNRFRADAGEKIQESERVNALLWAHKAVILTGEQNAHFIITLCNAAKAFNGQTIGKKLVEVIDAKKSAAKKK